jgi:hypothetical protein
MDKGSFSDLINLILWGFGGFVVIIGGLITVLWFMGKNYLTTLISVGLKNSELIASQQLEIKDLSSSTHESIELQKQAMKSTDKRLQMLEKKIFKL